MTCIVLSRETEEVAVTIRTNLIAVINSGH